MDESRMFAYHITDVCERATSAMHRITSLVQREWEYCQCTLRLETSSLVLIRRADHARAQAIVGREITTKRDVHTEIGNLWQEMWTNSDKARRVYEIFPNLDRIPPYFNPTPGLIHFITGHGPYPQYLKRFNLRDNSLCECGEEGTPEHVVLDCQEYDDQGNLRERLTGMNLREIIENEDTYNVLNTLAQKVSLYQQEIFNARRR
ncbi:hypothetical protein JTB14_001959 [Gonioctena quinquepunctata]|nr:hypothetical protein JTB14_001959 [Gonioctena quinquepunctata]